MQPDMFPCFTETEYRRREARVRELMADRGLDAVIAVGDSARNGSNHANVYWLTNWVDPYVSYAIVTARHGPWVLMSNPLYLHTARRAGRAESIEPFPYGKNPGLVIAEKLIDAGLAKGRIGIAGVRHVGRSSIGAHDRDALMSAMPEAEFEDAMDLFAQARMIKSAEELAWYERGAMLTDRVVQALATRAHAGMTEQQLQGIMHEAVVGEGGWMRVEFLGATPMHAPEIVFPWQYPSTRRLRRNDVLLTELSVGFGMCSGQIHRPFAVGADPTPEYQALYDLGVECYERVFEVLRPGNTDAEFRAAASAVVERNGYMTHDVLVHGWGLQIEDPRLDVPSSTIKRPQMPFTFQPGMLMVIQPNVVSPDGKRGLQVGNLVAIDAGGPRSLQHYPMEFIRID
ncbi:MAG: aminopeptidase P family protein [Burkholderiales bacterium]|nr:aminopeptidase P family protein [Burkholderiales bacterium]